MIVPIGRGRILAIGVLAMLPLHACAAAPVRASQPGTRSSNPGAPSRATASQGGADARSERDFRGSGRGGPGVCSEVDPLAVPPLALSNPFDSQQDKVTRASSPVRAKERSDGYSMADLQALARREQWEELLEHIEDVGPAERLPAWDSLLQRAATAYLHSARTSSHSWNGFFLAEQLTRRYPTLRTNPAFMDARLSTAKVVYAGCLRQSYSPDTCLESMRGFIAVEGTSPDAALAFGKLVRANLFHYHAVPFFAQALRGKGDPPQCADEDVRLAVLSGLSLPTDAEGARLARSIAAHVCFASLRPSIESRLGEGGAFTRNACNVFRVKGLVR